jgi:hypothetical protein
MHGCRVKRAANADASGGAKSAKKRKATTDFAEEEMPVSGDPPAPNTQIRFHLLFEAQKNVTRLEAQKLALAEEAATLLLQEAPG